MKKGFALSLIILSMIPVFAGFWESNELGQRLNPIDEFSESGWILSDNGAESELFCNGNSVYRRKVSDSIDEKHYSDGRTETTEYDNGRAISQIINDNGIIAEYHLFYGDDSLSGYTYSINGAVRKRVEFSSFQNKVLSVSGDIHGYFGSDFYSYELDGEAIRVKVSSDGTLKREEDELLERDEDGLFRRSVERDGIEWVLAYDDNLRLIEERSENSIIKYEYDGSLLVSRITYEDGIQTAESYVNGKLSKVTVFSGGNAVKERTILSDGKIEEIRYISSIPRYRFLYDVDGVRLLEASQL